MASLNSGNPYEIEFRLQRAALNKTVLVVDDQPSVRVLVIEVLQELGYTALQAADGTSGLKAVASKTRIDLLVTDVGPPGGMNGRQLADAGISIRLGLKVLSITGYAKNAVLGDGHLRRGMHVLTKPFAVKEVTRRVNSMIALK